MNEIDLLATEMQGCVDESQLGDHSARRLVYVGFRTMLSRLSFNPATRAHWRGRSMYHLGRANPDNRPDHAANGDRK